MQLRLFLFTCACSLAMAQTSHDDPIGGGTGGSVYLELRQRTAQQMGPDRILQHTHHDNGPRTLRLWDGGAGVVRQYLLPAGGPQGNPVVHIYLKTLGPGGQWSWLGGVAPPGGDAPIRITRSTAPGFTPPIHQHGGCVTPGANARVAGAPAAGARVARPPSEPCRPAPTRGDLEARAKTATGPELMNIQAQLNRLNHVWEVRLFPPSASLSKVSSRVEDKDPRDPIGQIDVYRYLPGNGADVRVGAIAVKNGAVPAGDAYVFREDGRCAWFEIDSHPEVSNQGLHSHVLMMQGKYGRGPGPCGQVGRPGGSEQNRN